MPRLFDNKNPDLNPAQSHCFVKRNIENCIEEFNHGGVYCTKCENGYIIDETTNTCVRGQIPNCGIYVSESECEKCESCLLYTSPSPRD